MASRARGVPRAQPTVLVATDSKGNLKSDGTDMMTGIIHIEVMLGFATHVVMNTQERQ